MNSNMIAHRKTLAVNGIKSEPMMLKKCFSVDIIHLMSDPEGNSKFSRESLCFPGRSRGKHQDSRKTKLTGFPRDLTLSVLLYF